MRNYWGKVFCCIDKGSNDDIGRGERIKSVTVELMQKKLRESSYIHQFQHNLKVQTVYSILSSLQFYWIEHITEKNLILNPDQYEAETKVKINFKISEDYFNTKMPELLAEVKKNKYTVMDGVFTSYAPKLFFKSILIDDLWDAMKNSLDLSKNFSRILKAGINGGGKSGEFFFFSSDNRLIIKTITAGEVKILLRLLPSLTKYFEENRDTIITKTYGLFSFQRTGVNEIYYFIVMKNINGYPSDCVERKYDLKGSTYTRSTIRPDLDISMERLKFYDTLKDLDFEKYEQKIWIPQVLHESFIDTLRRDSQFLRDLGLIDYSLAIYLINKGTATDMKQAEKKKREEGRASGISLEMLKAIDESVSGFKSNAKVENPFMSIQSAKEPLYYHMGIIDYLTLYTCRKSCEKWAKRIQKFNMKLDTSVQDPVTYSNRFIKFFEKSVYI
jgi:1-phosphatidylinositol-4-phosphate 5-kinase